MTPEERLAGMTPEERSTGLAPEETVLLLADDVLRRLPRDFIDALPEAVRTEVLRRVGSSQKH